jgi:hypothetical protein
MSLLLSLSNFNITICVRCSTRFAVLRAIGQRPAAMKQIVLCLFCFFATVVTVIVLVVLTLTSTTAQTTLQAQFATNSSVIFNNWNESLFGSVSRIEVVGSLFGSLTRPIDNQTFGSFIDALHVGDETIVLARLVRKSDVASFVESIRAEVAATNFCDRLCVVSPSPFRAAVPLHV